MSKPWETAWIPDGRMVRGGQGSGFPAIATDGSGRRAFVKTLTRQHDRRARRRFYREVTAYETLAGLGVPAIYDHNANDWATSAPLYLAIEHLDGGNLRDWLERNGRANLDQALALGEALGDVLTRCHEEGFIHRDIKPLNIMLRSADDLSTAVLVDFGLSFNHTDDDDLTRIGEEVGNRFLRLPEHALGGKLAVSDITQLAGVILYVLTGHEPRVLQDAAGHMPHQRPAVREMIGAAFSGQTLHRLLTVFDKAFTTQATDRYATAIDFLNDLNRVPLETEDNDDLAGLLAKVGEFTNTPDNQRLKDLRERLADTVHFMTGGVKTFASQHGLKQTQTGFGVEPAASPPYAQTSISVTGHDESTNFVAYRVEARGTSEFVASVDGVELWRGTLTDAALDEAVVKAAARAFLATRSGE
jgi:serine/threonine-protein kinase